MGSKVQNDPGNAVLDPDRTELIDKFVMHDAIEAIILSFTSGRMGALPVLEDSTIEQCFPETGDIYGSAHVGAVADAVAR